MTRLAFLLALPLALSACGDAEAPVDPDIQDPDAIETEGENVEMDEAAPAELDLSGTWTITRFNGSSNLSTFPITVTFADDQMQLRSDCIDYAYALNRQGNVIAPEQVMAQACPNGLSPAEQQLDSAMPQFNVIVARGEQALNFSGPGGNLLLGREGG
ncbi:hypothetical protein WJT74_10580 [Sphingomicrobium sp. XHP0239]|uniref:hypothetical protein n=1 Tax=Sphingomicrobium maritimum TaxID=3133972 RepID=UPI0031CC993F